MTRRADTPRTRRDFLDSQGVLLVVRDPPPPPPPNRGQPPAVPGNPAEGLEILVAVWDDGSVTALNGHIDMGTGIRTALVERTQHATADAAVAVEGDFVGAFRHEFSQSVARRGECLVGCAMRTTGEPVGASLLAIGAGKDRE